MRAMTVPPLETRSLKAQCAAHIEGLIISGELPVGSLLPPERDFAKQIGVSRPVLHEALVDLASKGFLGIEPRRGVRVKDFYREGTLATFEAIVLHADGDFAPEALADMLGFRVLIETEAARLAAERGGGEFLAALEEHLEAEARLPVPPAGLEERVALDLRFHLLVAEASGSRILPLVLNSIAPIYASLVRTFYGKGPDLDLVAGFHRRLVEAIAARDGRGAESAVKDMLGHGARLVSTDGRRPS
jgi:GntR family transcriptional regulator, transcriptional repressor for pyruvate dehydrogenase complex